MAVPVSLLLTTYRHGPYVEAALDGALSQSHGPLEIIVSDDASPDDTWARIEARVSTYRGPHRVVLQRHPVNIGNRANLMSAVRRATGRLHVLAHGDDIPAASRVQRLVQVWQQHRPVLLSSDVWRGVEPGAVRRLGKQWSTGPVSLGELTAKGWDSRMLGCSFAWDPCLWERFSMFDDRLRNSGDHCIPVRGALLGGFVYVAEPLLFWRKHARQQTFETGHGARSGVKLAADALGAQVQRLRDVRDARARRLWTGPPRALVQAERQVMAVMLQLGVQWSDAVDRLAETA